MSARYLLQMQGYGILLHACPNQVLWSAVNPNGLDSAVTFRDEAEVHLFLRTRYPDVDPEIIPPWRLLPVEADLSTVASLGACVKAGVPMWDVPTRGSC